MDRKQTANEIANLIEGESRYLGAPSFAYEIEAGEGVYTLDREGILTTPAGLVITLEEISSPPSEEQKATVSLEGHTSKSLLHLLYTLTSKQHLIRMAFGIDKPCIDIEQVSEISLPEIVTPLDFCLALKGLEILPELTVDQDQNKLHLALPGLTAEQHSAWQDLFERMSEKAKTVKWALNRPTQSENPKYAMRTWLLRLGMVGARYKTTRLILIESLSGHAAFRHKGEVQTSEG